MGGRQDGDRVVAGAFGEDAAISATSVRADVGAVYLFRRMAVVRASRSSRSRSFRTAPTSASRSTSAATRSPSARTVSILRGRQAAPIRTPASCTLPLRRDYLEPRGERGPTDRADTQRRLFGREVELQGEWLFVSSDHDPQPISPEEVDDLAPLRERGRRRRLPLQPRGHARRGFHKRRGITSRASTRVTPAARSSAPRSTEMGRVSSSERSGGPVESWVSLRLRLRRQRLGEHRPLPPDAGAERRRTSAAASR